MKNLLLRSAVAPVCTFLGFGNPFLVYVLCSSRLAMTLISPGIQSHSSAARLLRLAGYKNLLSTITFSLPRVGHSIPRCFEFALLSHLTWPPPPHTDVRPRPDTWSCLPRLGHAFPSLVRSANAKGPPTFLPLL